MIDWRMTALFSDGGVVGVNPSVIGGTWAWAFVENNKLVRKESGFIPATNPITNNITEFIAAVLALESMPDGWSGPLCSDSQVTLGRLCLGWKLANVPPEWVKRGSIVLGRLGNIEPILLQGHPTRIDLIKGIGAKRGLPVSKWNVLVDEACQKEGYVVRMDIEKNTSRLVSQPH